MELASRFIFFPLSPHAAIIDRVTTASNYLPQTFNTILASSRYNFSSPSTHPVQRRTKKKKKKKRTATTTSRFSSFTRVSFSFAPLVTRKFDRFAVRFSRRFNHFSKILATKPLCVSFPLRFRSIVRFLKHFLHCYSRTQLSIIWKSAREKPRRCVCVCIYVYTCTCVCLARVNPSGSMDRDRGKKRVRMWKEQERRFLHGWRSLRDVQYT